MNSSERIVVLIDMDCFYVQVEQRRQPSLKGTPCAVVQYNKWKGGGIIAVSYEARAKGVSRNMRGDEAKEKCPDIVLCMVPTANGKADLTRYRDAGAEVIQVLLQFGGIVERASVDEAYIDLTEIVNQKMTSITSAADHLPSFQELEHTYVVGYPKTPGDIPDPQANVRLAGLTEYRSVPDQNVARLLIAAAIVEEMRQAIYQQTSFRCSAGVSHNKVLAKFACGINKPNKQTVLPMESVPALFNQVKISKIRNLGGKLGRQLSQNLGIEFIGQLTEVPKSTLVEMYGVKNGEWLYEICRGIDHEQVKERHLALSVGCSKVFRGVEALDTRTKVKHWIDCLATELVERLLKDRELNNRTSKSLTVQIGHGKRDLKYISRVCHISQYIVDDFTRNIMATLELLNRSEDRQADVWTPAITMIGISAGKFSNDCDKSQTKIKAVKTSKRPSDNFIQSAPKDSATTSTHSPTKSFRDPSPIVPNNTQVCEPQFSNAAPKPSPSPIKGAASPKGTTMDKKRLFFAQNFGVAETVKTPTLDLTSSNSNKTEKTPTVDLTTSNSDKTANTSKRKSVGHEKGKKQSFFAKLMEASSKGKPSCKIESAFEELTNIDKNSKSENAQEQDKLPDQNVSLESKHNSIPVAHSVSPPAKKCQQTEEETAHTSLSMENIDMDVFNSLPLYLQYEIKKASRKTDAATDSARSDADAKRRKLDPPCSQPSIAGFFNPSPVRKPAPSSSKKSSAKKDKTKARKGPLQFNCLEENAVPLGFFRARCQASAVIRNAIEKQAQMSQKRKTDEKLRHNTSSD